MHFLEFEDEDEAILENLSEIQERVVIEDSVDEPWAIHTNQAAAQAAAEAGKLLSHAQKLYGWVSTLHVDDEVRQHALEVRQGAIWLNNVMNDGRAHH